MNKQPRVYFLLFLAGTALAGAALVLLAAALAGAAFEAALGADLAGAAFAAGLGAAGAGVASDFESRVEDRRESLLEFFLSLASLTR